MKLTVLGALKSKANSRRMVRSGNRTLFIKSKGAMEFVEGAEWQLKVQYKGQPIESQVKLKLDIYYPNNDSITTIDNQDYDSDSSICSNISEKSI